MINGERVFCGFVVSCMGEKRDLWMKWDVTLWKISIHMLRYSHQQKKTKQKQKAKHKNIAINQVVRAKQAKLKKRKHKIKNKT